MICNNKYDLELEFQVRYQMTTASMYQIVEFLLRTTNETQLKSLLLPGWILILLSLHLIKFDAGYDNLPRKEKQSVISNFKYQNKKLSQKLCE